MNNKRKIDDNDDFEEVIEIQTPFDISPEELIFKYDFRRIYLFSDINKVSIQQVVSQIHLLQDRDSEADIELYINSDGGILTDCFALIDEMDRCPCNIKTIVIGHAASAACLIASNGTQGMRYCGKNSEMMFHEAYGDILQVRESDFAYYKNEWKRDSKKILKLLSRNTGKPQNDIRKIFFDTDHDKYITAVQAKTLGLIDHILESRR